MAEAIRREARFSGLATALDKILRKTSFRTCDATRAMGRCQTSQAAISKTGKKSVLAVKEEKRRDNFVTDSTCTDNSKLTRPRGQVG